MIYLTCSFCQQGENPIFIVFLKKLSRWVRLAVWGIKTTATNTQVLVALAVGNPSVPLGSFCAPNDC